jgi:hypothetical protein
MGWRALRIQFAIIVSLTAAACGGGGGSNPPPPPPPPQAQTISFAQQGPLVLMVGTTLSNAASGGGGTGAVTYQSSNANVLTVNATSGVATGIAIGTSTITATKAADAGFTQAQATYTVNVQTTAPMSAWIGATDSQVTLPQLAVGKQFVRAPAATCTTPANVAGCPNSQSTAVAGTTLTDNTATMSTPAYYSLTAGSVSAAPTVVAAGKFSERIGHAALFFNNRYWVIGGGRPVLPNINAPAPIQHIILSDIWSSADGKSWKLETDTPAFGPRWFHQAVVHDGAMWVISGASNAQNFFTDVWSSTDGVNWTQRATNIALPWYSTHLNVVVFNGAMWAVSGGRSFSSTDGVTWTPRSAAGAIAGNNGRGYASLSVHNGNLWYIAGTASPQGNADAAVNDIWRSSDGIAWTQVVPSDPWFTPRIRHQAFVLNGRLWVFGGEVPHGAGDTDWALDAWSTADGSFWREEQPTSGLKATYLAKVVEQTGPDRVTLIAGIQRGYSNNVWQSTNGFDWTALSSQAQFSPRATRGVSFQGQLWIVGGSTAEGPDSGAVTNEVWRSPNGIDWTRVAFTGTAPPIRDGHSVVVFQDKLWVTGGWDNEVGGGGSGTRFQEVSSSSDGASWTKHDPSGDIWAPRAGHAMVVFQDKLWVIGGNLQDGSDVNDVWSSPDGVAWTREKEHAEFSARHDHRVVVFDDELWLTGGGTAGQGTADVYRSTDGITWTQVAAPPFAPRLYHGMVVFNDRMYVVAGVSGEDYAMSGRYNDVWSTSNGATWTNSVGGTVFAPRATPTLIVHSGELWVIGGHALSFQGDVWRSPDGQNWRVGFSQNIVVP